MRQQLNPFLPRQKNEEQYEYFKQSYKQQSQQCVLCTGTAIEPIVNHALYQKYSSSQDFFYTKQINQIIDQVEKGSYTPAVALFKQYTYWDDDHEQLRRMYQHHQYNNKLTMISEYYKFHRDVPMVYEKSVERLMEKYYGRVKQYDYKRIKKILKEEQGISLTTQKSESSFDQENSSFIKKSRYSTMLHGLKSQQSRDQSRILMEICDKIDKKIPIKLSHNGAGFHIKGNYQTGSKDFESFLQRQKMKKKRIQPSSLIKNKISHEQIQLGFSKQIGRGFKKPLAQRNFLKKSIQKTTANDTISREEKNKKIQKANFRGPYISNKKLVFTQKNFNGQSKMFKPLTSNLIAMKSTMKIKTVDQIYKKSIPVNNNIQKYQSDKIRKSLSTFGSSSKKIIRNSQLKSSNKKQKLISFASKQLRPQFKTIQLGQRIQRLPSRDRINSHIIRSDIEYENQLSDKYRQTRQLARSKSRKSISLGRSKAKVQVERQSMIHRKSTNKLQPKKIRTFSSKQLDFKERIHSNIEPKSKGISRYQSTDLRYKKETMQRAIQNKLGDPKINKMKM